MDKSERNPVHSLRHNPSGRLVAVRERKDGSLDPVEGFTGLLYWSPEVEVDIRAALNGGASDFSYIKTTARAPKKKRWADDRPDAP